MGSKSLKTLPFLIFSYNLQEKEVIEGGHNISRKFFLSHRPKNTL